MSNRSDEDPRPRATPRTGKPALSWSVVRALRCPDIVPPPSQPFEAVLEQRRSERRLTRAPLRQVINAIAFATRPRAILEGDAFHRSRRPSPSAGALHPVDLVLIAPPRAFRYEPLTHQVEVLRVARPEVLGHILHQSRIILPECSATPIVFVADLARVACHYDNPESLLWRDAGALLQTLALVATAYGLAFCPLGILGGPILDALGVGSEAAAVGAAVMGQSA